MATSFRAALHLLHVATVVLVHDALCPPQFRKRLPLWLRVLSSPFRLLSPAAKTDTNTGKRLARALEKLGPAYIKLGQLMSMRPDVFGMDITEGLQDLKDNIPPASDKVAIQRIETEFEKPINHLFKKVGPAVAAASLAQVHRATTLDGQDVAIKILRPGIAHRVALDVRSLQLAARIAHRILPNSARLKPRAFVDTVARSMVLELDLRLEAAACSEFNELGIPYSTAPAVVWPLSGKTVMTMTWLEGVPMNKFQGDVAVKKDLAKYVMESFLTQALIHGVFHADSHEGNVFVTPDHQLGYVDFGIVGRLSENERLWLARILWGFLDRDYMGAAQAHFDAGYVPNHHRVEDFAQALRAVGEPIFGQDAAAISMGKVLEQLFDITALYDMTLREELILLQKTMVAAEGAARNLDPEFDMWATSKPVVETFLKSALSPLARVKRMAKSAEKTVEEFATLPARLDQLQAQLTQHRRPIVWPWALVGGMALGAGLLAIVFTFVY